MPLRPYSVKSKFRRTVAGLFLPFLLPVLVLGLWELATAPGGLPGYVLPGPRALALTTWDFFWGTLHRSTYSGTFWRHAIASSERVAAGFLLVNNREVDRPGSDRGVVFQEDALFPWLTVRENIGYGLVRAGRSRGEIKEKVSRFIQLVGLEGFSGFYPDQLSGGMKQRVALARVLVNEPEALLMDEPFAGLDALTRSSMQNLLVKVWETIPQTILFITHDVDEALIISGRIFVMTAPPGCILDEVAVEFPRPRTLEVMASPDFLAVKRKLVHLLDQAQNCKRPLEIIPVCPAETDPLTGLSPIAMSRQK